MQKTLNFSTNIQLTLNQFIDLARQLPKKERVKLVSVLAEDNDFMTKEELVSKIKEGLEEVKLYKEGKIKLRTWDEFLADV